MSLASSGLHLPFALHAAPCSCRKLYKKASRREGFYTLYLVFNFADACFSQQRDHNKTAKTDKDKTTSANNTHNNITTCKPPLTTPTVCASYCAKFIFKDSFRKRPSPQRCHETSLEAAQSKIFARNTSRQISASMFEYRAVPFGDLDGL